MPELCALLTIRSGGSKAVLKAEHLPIEKIYVPVKRRRTLKSEVVRQIAESILEVGQQAPILVRADEGRFVLVEGLHRLEACKALGETTISGFLVSAQEAHQKTTLPSEIAAAAQRQKIERLRKLRLEKEAERKSHLTAVNAADERTISGPAKKRRGIMEKKSVTLSEWITDREKNGFRY